MIPINVVMLQDNHYQEERAPMLSTSIINVPCSSHQAKTVVSAHGPSNQFSDPSLASDFLIIAINLLCIIKIIYFQCGLRKVKIKNHILGW